jgi:pyruvate dehydrogenase E1 component
MASLQAAGTSYATHGFPVIPFYSFYSMFGFQRTGDQIWAFADARGRGFLMGGTAGRTTLAGEGLQHDDGHSHLLASAVPNIRAYDPAFAYELAAIVRDGIERMVVKGEDVFYYITMYNENYSQPPRPDGVEEGILRGLYRFRVAPDLGRKAQGARLVGSGAILQQALAAADLLAERFGVAAEVWSAPSFSLLRRDAIEAERWNRLHPERKARKPYVSEALPDDGRPVVAVSDWLKAVPDMVARWMPESYVSLGTDGFGRSDTREALRSFFEIDPAHIAVALLVELAKCGTIPASRVSRAVRELGIDPEKASPHAL